MTNMHEREIGLGLLICAVVWYLWRRKQRVQVYDPAGAQGGIAQAAGASYLPQNLDLALPMPSAVYHQLEPGQVLPSNYSLTINQQQGATIQTGAVIQQQLYTPLFGFIA